MAKIEGICAECKTPFTGRTYKNRPSQKYCSGKCRSLAGARAGGLANCMSGVLKRPSGPEHHLWKGGRKRRLERMIELRKMHPERFAARRKVALALKRGALTRGPCKECGETKVEAHHEDYFKPLEVIWLCRLHHREYDKRLGVGAKDFGS